MKKVVGQYPITVREERNIKRVSFVHFITDAFGAFNLERGLVYTFKLLFSKPGYLVHLYLNEGRFKIFNPFRLLLLTTALSLFLFYLAGPESFIEGFSAGFGAPKEDMPDTQQLQQMFLDWYNLILWIAIPIYGLFSFLFNRKSGYNYAEHMVMQTFHVCALNVLSVIGVVFGLMASSTIVLIVLLCVSLGYYFWLLSGWLGQRKGLFFIKNIVGYVLGNVIYILIISLAMTIYLMSSGGL
ncbi:MAG: DUF3667 domain-containing protein [Marinoscillum sp.]